MKPIKVALAGAGVRPMRRWPRCFRATRCYNNWSSSCWC